MADAWFAAAVLFQTSEEYYSAFEGVCKAPKSCESLTVGALCPPHPHTLPHRLRTVADP